MNINECKATVQEVHDDLKHGASAVNVFLCMQKLQAAIEGWPDSGKELDRLMKFEKDARAVLGCPYEIRPASFKNADGSDVMLRVVDDAAVLKLLRTEDPSSVS